MALYFHSESDVHKLLTIKGMFSTSFRYAIYESKFINTELRGKNNTHTFTHKITTQTYSSIKLGALTSSHMKIIKVLLGSCVVFLLLEPSF